MFIFNTGNMIMFWIVAIVVLCIIELATVALTTIWFAIGGVVALICAALDFSLTVQIIAFVITSLILLVFTRPLASKYVNKNVTKTNANALIGKTGVVISEILPMNVGQVKVSGQIWSAVSQDENETIQKDNKVIITKISGVKLIVKKID